jgi:hypothetical protein
MKKTRRTLILLFFALSALTVKAQSFEVQQLLLDWEKLTQLKSILNSMYEGYEDLSKGYTAIKDISEGNFNIHKNFLDGLLQVNPYIKQYKRVASIIQYQILIVKNSAAIKNFEISGLFSKDEVRYIKTVYKNLLKEGGKNLDDLLTVVTANELRMSDDERFSAIDRIFNDVQNKLMFLKSFNNSTSVLAAQRKYEAWEVQKDKILFGISK